MVQTKIGGTRAAKVLACCAFACGILSALAGAFGIGIAVVTDGQRVPFPAGVACIGSAVLLLTVAFSIFRTSAVARRAVALPAG